MTAASSQPGGQGTPVAAAEHPLEALDLKALRTYRAALREEEERISYWRRLVYARLDLIRVGMLGTDDQLTVADITRALGDTSRGRGRAALHRIDAHQPLPDLPALDIVWQTPADDADALRMIDTLTAAGERLSAYRTAVHDRLDAATEELIERYREDPRRALDVLDES